MIVNEWLEHENELVRIVIRGVVAHIWTEARKGWIGSL